MIRVNLKKKKPRAAGGTGIAGLNLNELLSKLRGGAGAAEETADFKNSATVKAIVIAAALYAGNYWIEEQKQKKIAVVRAEQAALQADIDRLSKTLEKTRGFESVKQQLEAYEQTVRTKLETISKLLASRGGPSKMLIQIAQAIPQDVWLTEMKVSETGISIAGSTPGYSEVSDFLKSLSESSFLYDPKISGIQENVSEKKDQLFQNFEISASRRRVQ